MRSEIRASVSVIVNFFKPSQADSAIFIKKEMKGYGNTD